MFQCRRLVGFFDYNDTSSTAIAEHVKPAFYLSWLSLPSLTKEDVLV